MHPDKKESLLGSSTKRKDKKNSMLQPCPMVIPGIQKNLSNLSNESTPDNMKEINNSYTAYERYANQDEKDTENSSVQSRRSQVSFGSQDTFSTFGEAKMWGGEKRQWRISKFFPTIKVSSSWAAGFVKSRTFKRVSIILILLNCILCAVATADFVTEDRQMEYYFDLAKNVFVYIMSFELLLQFLAHGIYMLTHGWLVFDFIFICSAWAFPNLLVMRTFRVVRTLRLASWIKDLKELVLALLLVIPKMFAIFFLLLILFLIFSILFTDLFKHTYKQAITDDNYFGSLNITLFTLFQIMTLDGWSNICKQIMTEYDWAWAPFIAFVIVSSFFFLNLVIAVVCEAVTSVHHDTVVKYIQDDISAATSVRDALKVEDRLEELACSVQLLMQAQVTLLDILQSQQQLGADGGGNGTVPSLADSLHRPNTSSEEGGAVAARARSVSLAAKQEMLRTQREALQSGLNMSLFQAKETIGKPPKPPSEAVVKPRGGSVEGSLTESVSLNSSQDENLLRARYMNAMNPDIVPLSVLSARRVMDQSSTATPPTPPPKERFIFDRDAGPSTPAFWRYMGLSDEHVERIMQAMEQQSLCLVREQQPLQNSDYENDFETTQPRPQQQGHPPRPPQREEPKR